MSSSTPASVKDPTNGDKSANRSVSFKSVALPAEHGSWSLVLEPILLGLLVAPSWGGLALAVASFALFLFNRPFKIFWSDWRRRRTYPRTAVARRYALLYGAIALAGSVAAFFLAGWPPFVPVLAAAPLIVVFMVYDQRPGRHWQAELAAPVAFAAVVASIALAGGHSWVVSFALWGFMIARSVPAVLYVRARLRLDKGKPISPWGAVIAHIVAVAAVFILVMPALLPSTAAIAAVILLARAIWGLSTYRWRSSVKALGFLETAFGLISVLLVALGFWIS